MIYTFVIKRSDMKKFQKFLLALIIVPCALFFCGCNVQTQYHSPTITEEVVINSDLTQAANEGMRSTVAIFTETSDGYAAGAGVIYSLNGETGEAYIITNYHVVVDGIYSSKQIASTIYAQPYGSEYCYIGTNGFGMTVLITGNNLLTCEYVGGSSAYDIALLRVQDDLLKSDSAYQKASEESTETTLKAASIASSTPKLGSTVIAIGNPNFEGLSATRGIISVESENITVDVSSENSLSTETVQYRAVRFDAAINGGNSGGGLFNEKGELVGIPSAAAEDLEDYSSAIPVNVAVAIAENILHGKSTGTYDGLYRLNCGLTYEAQNSKAVYDEATGLLQIKEDIIVTASNGLLYSAGIRVGDKIVSVEKDGVNTEFSRSYEFDDFLLTVYPGQTFSITWVNGDGYQKASVTTTSNYYRIVS